MFENKQIKKVWTTPAFDEISVEETLSGPMGTIVAEGGLYHT